MSSSTRRGAREPGTGMDAVLPWLLVGAVAVVGGIAYAGAHTGARLAGEPAPQGGFFVTVFGVFTGDTPWYHPWSTVVAVAAALVMLAVVLAVLTLRSRARSGGSGWTRVDPAARHLGRGRDIASLSRKQAQATATRLGVDKATPGLPIGRSLATGQMLYSGWEDCAVDVWGPRTGKTTARAIPAILEAPGAVVVTSNKRDVVDATRGPRLDRGRVWVFDPQAIVAEPPMWWWNPLSYVTDEVKATSLARIFMAYSTPAGAKGDAFFDAAGEQLLAGMLLAAAVDGQPVTQVYHWLANPNDDEPAAILAERSPMVAASLTATITSPDRQRGGVYGTAMKAVNFLVNPAALTWVTSGNGPARTQLDPAAFVGSTDTLYSLSKEGSGTTGPLVTALTVAVCEAAEQAAAGLPGGRLAVPMVAVLDEAANVCRWRDLPDLYSHYGSRGVCMMTILQSWSQGVAVWGVDGMRKLWSAANIKVLGGGVDDPEFLRNLSDVVGQHLVTSRSVSTSRQGRSTSTSVREEKILDVADLASLPRGRALLLASGARPTLIAPRPWYEGPHAQQVTASQARFDPGAAR